jgi:virginiamycin B lyase
MSHGRHAGRALATIVLLAVAAVASAAPAGAAARTITEFKIKSPNNQPGDMVVGSDNNVWFVDQATNKIGHISHTGVISGAVIPTANSSPVGIAEGSDGAIWFTEAAGNKIGRMLPGPAFSEFNIPTASSSPRGITAGPDGDLYFVENRPHTVNKINPTTHTISLVATLPPGSSPTRITSGPDGNLWVSETGANSVARVTPGGTVTQVALTGAAAPSRITSGPDGNVWATEPGTNHIAQITTAATPVLTEFAVTGKPTGIASATDGNLWVTLQSANSIARVSTSGSVKTFAIPSSATSPSGIVMGGDGNIYFSENAGDRIGRLANVAGHSSYVVVQDGDYSPQLQGIPVASGSTPKSTTMRWFFAGGASHSVTDASGMGLFAHTGAPGSTFSFTFTTAGKFNYDSTVAGDSQTGVVSVTPSAAVNGTHTAIIVTVATSVPGGESLDVQFAPPGSSTFQAAPGGTGITTNTYTFTPTNGAGVYKFQVRTNNGGGHSGFSPAARATF